MSKFRFDINALRAFAVISVLLFHLRIPMFSGGFAGVDIFFVISGYLMTKIIFEELEKPKFSILTFWDKRIKRIVPALIFLIMVVTIVGYFFYLPNEFKVNEKNAASSLLFLSNITYWQNSGYFELASENNIFLHTWSLSVEWQFYIIYPILLWTLNKFIKNRKTVFAILAISTLLLFCISVYWTTRSASASFYLLPTRTWEMLIGGLALMAESKYALKNRLILIIAYSSLIFSVIFLSERLLWPGLYTLIPVLGTFLIIVSNKSNYLIINNNFVQLIGKISYSLYLWHWPIIVFLRYMGIQFNFMIIIGIIILTSICAYLSYRFIESIKFRSSIHIILILASLILVTSTLSSFDSNYKSKIMDMADYKNRHKREIKEQFSTDCCFLEKEGNDEFKKFKLRDCLKIDSNKKNILLLGDSHAASLSSTLRTVLHKNNIKLLQATAAHCFPFLTENGYSEFGHQLYKYIFYDYLIKNKKHIDGVIIMSHWYQSPQPEIVTPLLKVIQYLNNLKIPVVIIGQTNAYKIPYPSIIAKGMESNTDLTSIYVNKNVGILNETLKNKLKSNYVDVYYQKENIKISKKLDPFEFDDNHVTQFGADLIVKKVYSNPIFIKNFNAVLFK